MESTDARKAALQQWLSALAIVPSEPVRLLPHDASFRRYYRVCTAQTSFIVMDAPPLREDCRPFVAVAGALRAHGLQAPAILAEDLAQGFLLLTDFSDQTYLKALNTENADALYQQALAALAVLQSVRDVPGRVLPFFTKEFMLQEWAWHKEWFSRALLGLTLSDELALDNCYLQINRGNVIQRSPAPAN